MKIKRLAWYRGNFARGEVESIALLSRLDCVETNGLDAAVSFCLIARALHRLDEASCNYGLSARQETRISNLEKQAAEIAAAFGGAAYHQGDPRGAALYFLPAGIDEGHYTNGIAF